MNAAAPRASFPVIQNAPGILQNVPGVLKALSVLMALLLALATGACSSASGTTGPSLSLGTGDAAPGFEQVAVGSEEEFMLNVGRRTYFAENSAELNETARATLDKQVEWLQRNPGWLIKLQGFADDPGSEKANVSLSDRRAEAVMAYLASRGIDSRRMWAKGYGRERLIRDCPDIACKSQNRRVISNLREEFDAAAR